MSKIKMKRSQQLVTLNTKKYARNDPKRHPKKEHLERGKTYSVTDDQLKTLEHFELV